MEAVADAKINTVKEWLSSGSINIFGLPFSGKDTHGTELAKFFDGRVIGGGDILRSQHGPEHIKAHIAKGLLAPTDEYLAIILPYLSQPKLAGHPLILSSVGRWEGEEKSILVAADESGHPIKAVLYLHITKNESKRRWKLAERGRHDDQAEHVLEKRFAEFNEKTLPVIEFYRQQSLLIEIDSELPIPNVTNTIIHALHHKATARES